MVSSLRHDAQTSMSLIKATLFPAGATCVLVFMVVTMQSNGSGGGGGDPPEEFVEVWSGNLEEEFTRMRKLVLKFPYIAMVGAETTRNRTQFIARIFCAIGYRVSWSRG